MGTRVLRARIGGNLARMAGDDPLVPEHFSPADGRPTAIWHRPSSRRIVLGVSLAGVLAMFLGLGVDRVLPDTRATGLLIVSAVFLVAVVVVGGSLRTVTITTTLTAMLYAVVVMSGISLVVFFLWPQAQYSPQVSDPTMALQRRLTPAQADALRKTLGAISDLSTVAIFHIPTLEAEQYAKDFRDSLLPMRIKVQRSIPLTDNDYYPSYEGYGSSGPYGLRFLIQASYANEVFDGLRGGDIDALVIPYDQPDDLGWGRQVVIWVGSNPYTFTPEPEPVATAKSNPMLSAPQLKLLSVLWNYQKEWGADALAIMYDGLLMPDAQGDERSTDLMYGVFGEPRTPRTPTTRLTQLVRSVPPQYIRLFPVGARFDVEFILSVTDDGARYLATHR